MYVLGIRPVAKAIQLVIGTVLHAWLEVWLDLQSLGGGPQWVAHTRPPDTNDEFDPGDRSIPEMQLEVMFEQLSAVDAYEAARLRAMVLAYHLRWRTQDWRVLAVELEFRAPLENPISGEVSTTAQRGGKIDAIVEIDDGVFVVEHKSHKGPLDPGDIYLTKLRADAQCSDYFIGARGEGYNPAGIIYDVVCKPAIDPRLATPVEDRKMTQGVGCKTCGGANAKQGDGKKRRAGTEVTNGRTRKCVVVGEEECATCTGSGWKEAPRYYSNVRLEDESPGEYGLRCFEIILTEPHRYLVRHRVVRLDSEIVEHAIDGWYDVKSMQDQAATGVASRNPEACYKWGRPCEFTPACWGGVSINDSKLYSISTKHPELKVIE